MGTLAFSDAPIEEWKDDGGAQAIFAVTDSGPMLKKFMEGMFPFEGLNTQWEWEISIEDTRPGQMMVVCSADIPDSEWRQGLAIIAARCSCITTEEFERFKQQLIKQSMAVSSDDTMAWNGSAFDT